MAPPGSGRPPKLSPPADHGSADERATLVPGARGTWVKSDAPTADHVVPAGLRQAPTLRPPEVANELDIEVHVEVETDVAELNDRKPLSTTLVAPYPPDQRDTRDPLQVMRDSLALGDFSGALATAEAILQTGSANAEVVRCTEVCRERLYEMYAARLGSLEAVPRVLVAPQQVRWLSLDHRAGFILSCVDGQSTVEEILDVAGMPVLDAMRILFDLHTQRIIGT